MTGRARNLYGATLDAERLRNARGLLAVRAALTLAFLGVTVAALAIGVRGARARLPIVAVYCAVSVALYAIGRKRLEILRHAWLPISLVDVPAVHAFQRAAMREAPEQALLVAAMTVGIYLLLLMAVQLAMRRVFLVLTAVTGYALLIALFASVPGVSRTVWVDAFLLIAAAAVIGRYLSARLLALVEKAAGESRPSSMRPPRESVWRTHLSWRDSTMPIPGASAAP